MKSPFNFILIMLVVNANLPSIGRIKFIHNQIYVYIYIIIFIHSLHKEYLEFTVIIIFRTFIETSNNFLENLITLN